jgi:hypothetical protein
MMDIRKRKIISLTTIRRQHLNHWIEFYFRIISISATVYNVRILCLSCNIKKSKVTTKLYENSRNKRRSKRFQWYHP